MSGRKSKYLNLSGSPACTIVTLTIPWDAPRIPWSGEGEFRFSVKLDTFEIKLGSFHIEASVIRFE